MSDEKLSDLLDRVCTGENDSITTIMVIQDIAPDGHVIKEAKIQGQTQRSSKILWEIWARVINFVTKMKNGGH